MKLPPATRCPFCGAVAAEFVCHLCKRERPSAPLYRDPLTWLTVIAYVWTFDVWRYFV